MKAYDTVEELKEAENKRREENNMVQILNAYLHKNIVFGEIKLSNPIGIGHKKKDGKYYLFQY